MESRINLVLDGLAQKKEPFTAAQVQKMKDKGKDVDEMEQKNKDKKHIFLGYFGKYLEDKGIARYVQKDILKNQLIE